MYRYRILLIILTGSFLIPSLISAQTGSILYTRHLHGGTPVNQMLTCIAYRIYSAYYIHN